MSNLNFDFKLSLHFEGEHKDMEVCFENVRSDIASSEEMGEVERRAIIVAASCAMILQYTGINAIDLIDEHLEIQKLTKQNQI
jgi:hypothetical protein